MKKILIGSAICLSIVGCKEEIDVNQIEITNYAEDMKSYLYYDIENGVIDTEFAISYLEICDEIIRLNNE